MKGKVIFDMVIDKIFEIMKSCMQSLEMDSNNFYPMLLMLLTGAVPVVQSVFEKYDQYREQRKNIFFDLYRRREKDTFYTYVLLIEVLNISVGCLIGSVIYSKGLMCGIIDEKNFKLSVMLMAFLIFLISLILSLIILKSFWIRKRIIGDNYAKRIVYCSVVFLNYGMLLICFGGWLKYIGYVFYGLYLCLEVIGLTYFSGRYTEFQFSGVRIYLSDGNCINCKDIEKIKRKRKYVIINSIDNSNIFLYSMINRIEYYGEPKIIINKGNKLECMIINLFTQLSDNLETNFCKLKGTIFIISRDGDIMKKIQSIKLTLHNFKVRGLRILRRWRYRIISLVKKAILPSVIVSCIVAFILIIFLLFCAEDTRVMWEDILSQMEYKMNLIGQIITIISLFAAAVGIFISLQKPKFNLAFITDHGYGLKEKERQFGVDENNRIGYQSCVPSDWRMFLYNVGNKVAENVKVKIQIDYITFGNVDKNSGYILEDFVYGCGVFETLSLDLTDIIRQGESVEIPKIPFEYACVEVPNLKEKEFTHMHLRIYCNNQSPIYLKYCIRLEDYDIGEYDYHEEENEIKKKQNIEENINEVLNSLRGYICDTALNIYNYMDLIDPYIIKRKDIKEFDLRNVYMFYSEISEIDKMIFWGRMYYRSVGMKKCDIEAIIQTEIIRRK